MKKVKMNNKKEVVDINFLDIEENSKYIELINVVMEAAFKEEKLENSNTYINIILTNPENIRKTKKKYRNIDRETDVLSFPMFEKEEIEVLKEQKNQMIEVLGDVMISIERVKQQSEEYGHSFERELSYMLVHGFYHLMGYDHIEENDKIQMREKEEKLLNKLNMVR